MNRKSHIRIRLLAVSISAIAATIVNSAGAGPAWGEEDRTSPKHEASAPPWAIFSASLRVFEAPPAPKVENPGSAPRPGEVFAPGYWSWSDEGRRYLWVAGIWREPPPNRIWIAGLWLRDQDPAPEPNRNGWRWSPGFWSRVEPSRLEYRSNGPPDAGPVESSGSPPIAASFRIRGHYRPDGGDRVAWQPGFWTKALPGWSWGSARWVERDLGWVFVPGYWERATAPDEPAPARDPILTLNSTPMATPALSSRPISLPRAATPCRSCRKPTTIVQGPPLWLRTIGIIPGSTPLFPYRPYLYNNPYHYALAQGWIPSSRTPGRMGP